MDPDRFDNPEKTVYHGFNMSKLLPVLLAIMLLAAAPFAHAEDFTLQKIGALNVNGKYYNHWWYEPTKLVLEGTGSKGANIDVYVDGSVKTIKASVEDGAWKYEHGTELEKKDHDIKVSSGGKDIAFVLTIGSSAIPENAGLTEDKGSLPEAGTFAPLVVLLGLGGFLVYNSFRQRSA